MRIDGHTIQDLEILGTESGPAGLLDQLNRTRTRAGREAFRRRLTRPLSSATEIKAVQSSLRYIRENRLVFDRLPTDPDIVALNQYLGSGYVLLTRTAGPAVTVEGWWIRVRYADLYALAEGGVILVARFLDQIDTLQSDLRAAPGCLAAFLQEMRGILASGELQSVRSRKRRLEAPSGILLRDYTARETARGQLRRLIEIVAELDALVSMSDVTVERGFAFPVFQEGHWGVELRQLYHPFLDNPVGNDLVISADARLVFLTGPNMAGKTTYLKAAGIAVLLAHTGMGVPAHDWRLSVIDHLTTAIRTEDNLKEGISYFQAEARRVREMSTALAAVARCLFIVDELFRGTNVKDAHDASLTVLQAFAVAPFGLFLVASHLIELADEIAHAPSVVLRRFEADLVGSTVAFDYRIEPGVSSQRLGMMVLEREGVLQALAEIRRVPPNERRTALGV